MWDFKYVYLMVNVNLIVKVKYFPSISNLFVKKSFKTIKKTKNCEKKGIIGQFTVQTLTYRKTVWRIAQKTSCQ